MAYKVKCVLPKILTMSSVKMKEKFFTLIFFVEQKSYKEAEISVKMESSLTTTRAYV